MLGYWDNPEDTKAIIDETRWLHSGDIAVMDENGYVSKYLHLEKDSQLVKVGDKVKKGQLLGVIDPEQAENQIREVEATLMELRAQRAQAQAERNLAQVTLTRCRTLCRLRQGDDLLPELAQLRQQLQQLDELERLSLRNIL